MIALVLATVVASKSQCLQTFPIRVPGSARAYFYKFDAVFVAVARRRQLEPSLLKAIAYCETRFDPCAESPAGARGLMQFIPSTFSAVSDAAGVTNPYDPMDAVEAAGVYVATLSAQWGGDAEAIVASYNAGPGAVQKARRQGRRIPNIPETQGYVACVLDAKARLDRGAAPTNILTAAMKFFMRPFQLTNQGEEP